MTTPKRLSEADGKKLTEAERWSIRGSSDEELARSGTLLKGAPPMTAEPVIVSGLLDHIDEHFGSIRKTVGH